MVINGEFSTKERMRLSCNLSSSEGSYSKPHDNSPKELFSPIGLSAMNEVSIHRSHSPHMIPLNISIEGELLTQAVADGLIIATPTGSTAYSCSAGGPIVHPNMEAILVTPICPRSLSFRPLILPSDVTLKLNLDPRSESPAELNLDGISIATIKPGESIEVKRSDSPIKLYTPCTGFSTNYYWINDLNLMLNFNQSFQSKQPSPVIKLK
ncbi:ATP-NAD kinase-like domain-containing protein [Phakopsora pachyrhizi]|nr:ATP-NAD kinase-like domain-containing protein [Phakopsora pachyrhizi]